MGGVKRAANELATTNLSEWVKGEVLEWRGDWMVAEISKGNVEPFT